MLIKKDEIIDYSIYKMFKNGESLYAKYDDLLKLFSTFYISSLEDLKTAEESFYSFLMSKAILLADCTQTSVEEVVQIIVSRKGTYSSVFKIPQESKATERYVNIVNDIAPSKNIHLLDVGSGALPYSAILFGQKFDEVTTMDSDFWLSKECFKKMNVNTISKFFNLDTPIDTYGMVVGKSPCSAIDAIVYSCAKHNKPYFLITCDCNLPTKEGFSSKFNIKLDESNTLPYIHTQDYINYIKMNSPRDTDKDYSWHALLPAIDPNVKFCGNVAYNIDASPKEVQNIIEKYSDSYQKYQATLPNLNFLGGFQEPFLDDFDIDEYAY